jgi:tetratricopeptide (TPR) repeat protein
LDPTWGTNFVDATHIKSSSSEFLAYAALNLIGLEVLEARRSVPDFQKDASKLAETLCDGSRVDRLEDVLAVAIDPATLIDATMGENTWSRMNAAERDQVYAAQRRLVIELHELLKDDSDRGRARVLNVKQQEDRAQALIMLPGWTAGLIRLRLIRKGEVWFIEELRYEDSAYDLLAETARSTAVRVLARRNGTKLPSMVDSAETRILLAESNSEIALQIAEQALKDNPNSPTLLFLKAVYLFNASKDAGDKAEMEAVKLLTELSDRQPAFAPAIRRLGDFYADVEEDDPQIESKRDKAIDLIQRYAALAPEDPRPHESLAQIYEARRDHGRAEVEYRALIERDPQLPDNYGELARFLVTQQRYKEALAAIDQSRGRGTSKDELFAQLFYATKDDREAVQRVEALAAAAADRLVKNSTANLRFAWVRIADGRFIEALPLLKTAAALDPKNAEPHVTMAEAYRKLQNWQSALKAGDTAIRLDADSADAYFHKACALAQLRRPAESIVALKKAIELDEDLMFTEDLEAEEDLKPLARLPAFKKIVKETKEAEQPPDDSKKKNDK